MRKPAKYLSLKRPRLRQSWNVHNLYNLVRLTGEERRLDRPATFFQQKWSAKSRTRAYHGEHIPEKKWKRMFSRQLNSAVDMPPQYLAIHDGSEQAAGRGSGLEGDNVSAETYSTGSPFSYRRVVFAHPRIAKLGINQPTNVAMAQPLEEITPYMQMTFAPLERRLDTAVFRALFASSVRQARQFVIHGAVKVNGKKITFPSYLLNPGDMFQVEVDKVLYATGVQKSEDEVRELRASEKKEKKRAAKLNAKPNEKEAAGDSAEASAEPSAEPSVEASAESAEASEDVNKVEEPANIDEELSAEELELEKKRVELESVLLHVKMVLRDQTELGLDANKKRRLRLFRKSARRLLAQKGKMDIDELLENLQTEMKNLGGLGLEDHATEDGEEEHEANEERLSKRKALVEKVFKSQQLKREEKEKIRNIAGYQELSKAEIRRLSELLKEDAENPIDDRKPYLTPWQPRPFLKPFAFVPRYLEVNPTICAAVYLRHPVARKGRAEVPTPFQYFTSQLAHNWYQERG